MLSRCPYCQALSLPLQFNDAVQLHVFEIVNDRLEWDVATYNLEWDLSKSHDVLLKNVAIKEVSVGWHVVLCVGVRGTCRLKSLLVRFKNEVSWGPVSIHARYYHHICAYLFSLVKFSSSNLNRSLTRFKVSAWRCHSCLFTSAETQNLNLPSNTPPNQVLSVTIDSLHAPNKSPQLHGEKLASFLQWGMNHIPLLY